ncbi:MAG: hypothetical protein M4579_003209 [Chaenotheca gracillima]|nr:MAG: hypothetical protein M4579_003209 [Chaenotheca gracillima]
MPASPILQSDSDFPKALLESGDYGGLQRDDRIQFSPDEKGLEKGLSDQHDTFKTVYVESPRPLPFGNTMSEMAGASSSANRAGQFKGYPQSHSQTMTPISPDPSSGNFSTDNPKGGDGNSRQVYGIRRRTFFLLLAAIILIAIAVLVGGIVGGVTAKNRNNQALSSSQSATPSGSSTISSSPTSSAPAPPESTSAAPIHLLLPNDPLPGASISTLAFMNGGDPKASDQSYRLYFQGADNDVKEVVYDGSLGGWTNSTPIFTDACNFTGLASFTYMNGSRRMERIYYNGMQYPLLQEKIKDPNESLWLPGPMSALGIQSNTSLLTRENNGAAHMSAVYSTRFASGAGARFFYHAARQDTGTDSWVQELVWSQKADTWTKGAQIKGPVSTSQLAATIQDDFLRLFYSTANGTLQESFIDITDKSANYTNGITQTGILGSDDGPISVVSLSNMTLVYFSDKNGTVTELKLVGAVGSSESASINPSKIATPSKQNPLSLGSVIGSIEGGDEPVTVFYTDIVNDVALSTIVFNSRNLSSSTWPANASDSGNNYLPLGNGS